MCMFMYYITLVTITNQKAMVIIMLRVENKIIMEQLGTTFTNPAAKADVLADYFSSIFTCVDESHIHMEGVAQLLLSIQVHKAMIFLFAFQLKEVTNEIVLL